MEKCCEERMERIPYPFFFSWRDYMEGLGSLCLGGLPGELVFSVSWRIIWKEGWLVGFRFL